MSKSKHPLSGMAGGSNSNSSNKDKNKSKADNVKERYARKYSTGIPLAEQIMMAGRSWFLQIIDGKPKLLPFIDLSTEKGVKLLPNQTIGSTSPIIEYEYNDLNEIEYFIDRASRMKIDDLYFLIKSIFKDVIATDEPHLIVLLATDAFMTYFQDLFVTTHYVVFEGPPGWGKGAILTALKLMAYRVVLAGDMSGANLLDLLGSIEKCQVTLCEDEFDKIQDDLDKERIYKMGYEDIGSVTRTVDPSSSDRKLVYYNPYCMKFFASEKGPDSKELGGFNDRLFREEVNKGKSKRLIKEIKNQMERTPDKQLPRYRTIVSRINFLRKVLLVYRLLHHKDTIEEVPLNISYRALELCSPAIRLFNSENLAAPNREALNEILPTLSHYLRKKGQLDERTIELVIHNVLIDLFNQMDKEQENPGTSTIIDNDDLESCVKRSNLDIHGNQNVAYVISHEVIGKWVMKEIEGNLISPRTFESAEYGRTTFDGILSVCRRIYKAQSDRITKDKNKNKKDRALSFNRDKVAEAGKKFEVVSEIRILSEDEQDEEQDESPEDKSRWDEWTNGKHAHTTNEEGGTKVQISSENRGKGEMNGSQDNDIQDSQNDSKNIENTITSDKNTGDFSNVDHPDGGTNISFTPPNDEKYVPLYPQDLNHAQNEAKEGGTNIECDLRNQKGADRFKAEVDRLSKQNKVANMAEANPSGNGLMENV